MVTVPTYLGAALIKGERVRPSAISVSTRRSIAAGRARCPWGTELPLSLEETVVGGAIWLVGYRTRLEGGVAPTELVSDITYFLLVPYLGVSQARRDATGAFPLSPQVSL